MNQVYCIYENGDRPSPIRTEFPVRIGKIFLNNWLTGFCILNENLYEERRCQILKTRIYIIVTQYETWLTLFCRLWRIICWILHLSLRCFRGLSQTFAKGITTDKEIRLNIPLQWFRMHFMLYASVFSDNG